MRTSSDIKVGEDRIFGLQSVTKILKNGLQIATDYKVIQ